MAGTGPTVDRVISDYVLKPVNGQMCMTYDLRQDPTSNTVVDVVTAFLGG